MKKLFSFFILSLLMVGWPLAAIPDFSCVGFASLNGGTTGGAGGTSVTVVNLYQFKKYVGNATPCTIYVKGTLEGAGGGELVEIGSNKTIIGIDTLGKVLKVSFYCKNSKNLILQNLFFSMSGSTLGSDADCISIATTSSSKCQNIWVDHCTFDNKINPVSNPSASQKDQYDGLCDIKKSSEYITISWCIFKNHYKSILVGYTSDDTYDRKITLHHNAFLNIGSRTPSYRGGTAHIYNNYWEGCYDPVSKTYFSTGVNTREAACLYVESNYFKNMDKTVYCALEDVVLEGYAFYRNNAFENSNAETATTCSSFTPPYTVAVDNATDIPVLVKSNAGIGILPTPANIPAEDTDLGSVSLGIPYLNEATNMRAAGFDVSWNGVENATSYLVNASYENGQNSTYLFHETFNNMKVGDNLTSNSTDNPASTFVLKNGGSLTSVVCEQTGSIKLAGTRFCIANLNLTGNLFLTLKVKALTATGKFQVALDVAGTSGVGGLMNAACGTDIPTTEYKTYILPLTTGTATSFIQFRCESTATVSIDEISISNSNLSSTVTLPTVSTTNTTCILTGLTAGTEYKVWVVAKDALGNVSNSSNSIYATPVEITALNHTEQNPVQVYSLNGQLYIQGAEGQKLEVYTITGSRIYSGSIFSTAETIPVKLNMNVYIVVLNGRRFKLINS